MLKEHVNKTIRDICNAPMETSWNLDTNKIAINALSDDKLIFSYLTTSRNCEDAQVLMQWTMLNHHKTSGLDELSLDTEYGRNFARLVYFIDHDLENGKLNGPGILMTPGDGIDVICLINTELNLQFKQYMTTIFSQYVPDETSINFVKSAKEYLLTHNSKDNLEYKLYGIIAGATNGCSYNSQNPPFNRAILKILQPEFIREISKNSNSYDRVKYLLEYIETNNSPVTIENLTKLRALL